MRFALETAVRRGGLLAARRDAFRKRRFTRRTHCALAARMPSI